MIRVTKQGHKPLAPENGALVDGAAHDLTAHYYTLAGQNIVFETEVNALQAFSDGVGSESYSEILVELAARMPVDEVQGKLTYEGSAPFADVVRNVKCWECDHLIRIDVDDTSICLVDVDNHHIHVLNEESFDQALNLQVVTGPALIILLATKGIYCLHASSIGTQFGNIAFIAESGVGKSTLGAHIDSNWQQLADDILPLHQRGDHYQMFDYPQLKLPRNATELPQPRNSMLDLIIRLSNEESQEMEFTRLPRTEGLIEIVRHTVAAKLFDNALMIEHVRFAKFLSGEVPVVELKYPRNLERLNHLRFAIFKYLRNHDFD